MDSREDIAGNLQRIATLEEVNAENAELSILQKDESPRMIDSPVFDIDPNADDLAVPSTSAEYGVRSPRSEMEHHLHLIVTAMENSLSSDEEEFNCTQVLSDQMNVMEINDGHCAGDYNIDSEDGSDVESDQEGRPEGLKSSASTRFTSVGPMKNDLDPLALQRVVNYGKMKKVQEVSVQKESAPEELHTTLEQLEQKRRTLGKLVGQVSQRFAASASLPRDLKGWTSPQNLKSSAASVMKKSRSFLRNSGKILRFRRSEGQYYSCQESAGLAQEQDTLSEVVSLSGEPNIADIDLKSKEEESDKFDPECNENELPKKDEKKSKLFKKPLKLMFLHKSKQETVT